MSTFVSTVAVKWVEGTLMTGADSRGKTIVIGNQGDGSVEMVGVKPSDLLLLAAASCSTYDIVTILAKQKEPVEKFDVVCTGEQMKAPPNRFSKIHLHYIVKGKVNAEKLSRAIHLSEEKYCSVLATLRDLVITSCDFEIIA